MQIFALALVITILAYLYTKFRIRKTNMPGAKNAIELENELINIVNEYRASLGTSQLLFNQIAYKYANQHNDYMISKGSISHDRFKSRASKISTEANAKAVAENVAKGYSNAKAALDGWLSSKGHRTTIEGDFTHTAVSVKMNSKNQYYFTQLFFKKHV